jgi:hypothetical protein
MLGIMSGGKLSYTELEADLVHGGHSLHMLVLEHRTIFLVISHTSYNRLQSDYVP